MPRCTMNSLQTADLDTIFPEPQPPPLQKRKTRAQPSSTFLPPPPALPPPVLRPKPSGLQPYYSTPDPFSQSQHYQQHFTRKPVPPIPSQRLQLDNGYDIISPPADFTVRAGDDAGPEVCAAASILAGIHQTESEQFTVRTGHAPPPIHIERNERRLGSPVKFSTPAKRKRAQELHVMGPGDNLTTADRAYFDNPVLAAFNSSPPKQPQTAFEPRDQHETRKHTIETGTSDLEVEFGDYGGESDTTELKTSSEEEEDDLDDSSYRQSSSFATPRRTIEAETYTEQEQVARTARSRQHRWAELPPPLSLQPSPPSPVKSFTSRTTLPRSSTSASSQSFNPPSSTQLDSPARSATTATTIRPATPATSNSLARYATASPGLKKWIEDIRQTQHHRRTESLESLFEKAEDQYMRLQGNLETSDAENEMELPKDEHESWPTATQTGLNIQSDSLEDGEIAEDDTVKDTRKEDRFHDTQKKRIADRTRAYTGPVVSLNY